MRRSACLLCVAIALGLLLTACSSHKQDPFAGVGSPRYPGNGPLPKGGGRYYVGKSYQVAGQWFSPAEQPDYDKVGIASWYGPQFHRRQTSNGEWFDMNYLSAAHATLPLPSYAKVTNLENGRKIIVRVNDRGPFVGTRIIDLSRQAAEKLDIVRRGMAKVRVQYLGPAPLNDKGAHLAAMNQRLEGGSETGVMIASAERKTTPSQPPAVAAISAMPPSDAPPPDASGYFVQVGSFANPDNAERAGLDMASAGPVQIVPLSGVSGTLYRVRVGPLNDENAAQMALAQAVGAGHSDARVILAQSAL